MALALTVGLAGCSAGGDVSTHSAAEWQARAKSDPNRGPDGEK